MPPDHGHRGRRDRQCRDQRRLRPRPATASTSTRAWRACASRSTTPSRSARPTRLRRDRRCSATTAPTPASARPAAASSSAPDDFNPERIILDDQLGARPARPSNVGDHFTGADRRRRRLQLRQLHARGHDRRRPRVRDGLTREATTPPAPNQLAVATFNVENLDPSDAAGEVRRAGGPDRQQPAVARPDRRRGGAGQQRRDRTTAWSTRTST